jgi:hypothetical protein
MLAGCTSKQTMAIAECSRSTIFRAKRQKLGHKKLGRKKKLRPRQVRQLVSAVGRLRKTDRATTREAVAKESGIDIHKETVGR